ncbi:hypothetical protein M569_12203 [Genlisea aurea]|uniref:Katanin p80 WD40 repeat-containing subunit B1 homolog n=1 Tax=Genlisea aurea TaxID=192259 RepID=S8CDM2_9LAMI|nr:hypothetical protein M569_12203 [Genlisea aurea]
MDVDRARGGSADSGFESAGVVVRPYSLLPKPEVPWGAVERPLTSPEKLESQATAIGKFFRQKSSSVSAAITKRLLSSFVRDDDDGVEAFDIVGVKVIKAPREEDPDGRVTFFSRSACRDSGAVRSFFRRRKLNFVEINVDVYPEREEELREKTGGAAVPQIFFNDTLIGGLVALNSLRNSGMLEVKMEEILSNKRSENAPTVPVYGSGEMGDPTAEDDMAVLVRVAQHRVPIQDRVVKMKFVKNSFSGADLVEVLIHHLDCGRRKAVEVGKQLARKHFFHDVLGGNEFEDGKHYYRFLEHEPFIPNCHNFQGLVKDSEPKPASVLSQRLFCLMSAILESYASDDRNVLDYVGISNSEEFRRYLNLAEDLQRVDLTTLGEKEKLSFFLNLHNAMAIHAVIRIGPPGGMMDRMPFFADFMYVVGGYPYSLSTITNGILRDNRRPPYSLVKPFSSSDPRLQLAREKVNQLIHFGIWNAAKGSPSVRFFTAKGVDCELRNATREFLQRDDDGVKVDLAKRTVYFPKVIKWYNSDFGQEKETVRWIVDFLDASRAGLLMHLLSDGGSVNVAYHSLGAWNPETGKMGVNLSQGEVIGSKEFVAHSLSVNCLKIGRKSSRVLVTGGEDHKVNLWAIGKPNAILSLSGHSSGVDSVSFDSSEVLVAAGAASGTIKLWDLEEAKIIRTLTGHRSNCISLDFHPFGEFFASGSLDTNLKIWDIRRKGCIHTYKGHTRGVNAIRFTPDGRWVVSGGEDNTVKAKYNALIFILMSSCSLQAQLTELLNSGILKLLNSLVQLSTGVRCMTFNPDGRTLLCGLHENLKIFSWEPIRSHDAVDVGWSRLSDMNVHEGKLLGCSYNQSCVGVWVVDISRTEPYALSSSAARLNGDSDPKSSCSSASNEDSNIKVNSGRLSVSSSSDTVRETRSFMRLPVHQNTDLSKDSKSLSSTSSTPSTPQRSNPSVAPKTVQQSGSTTVVNVASIKRPSGKVQSSGGVSIFNRSDAMPVIVPRNNPNPRNEEIRDDIPVKTVNQSLQSKSADPRKLINMNHDYEGPNVSNRHDGELLKASDSTIGTSVKSSSSSMSTEVGKGILSQWEQKSRSNYQAGYASSIVSMKLSAATQRSYVSTGESQSTSNGDDDAITDLMEMHDQFVGSMKSRLSKLQVVLGHWRRHDIKGALSAMKNMGDCNVLADVISLLEGRTDIVNLDICSCLLPLLTGLIESDTDRHQDIGLSVLLKLVRVFGSMIYSSLSAPASVGVDIEAEQRLERYSACYVELEKVKNWLPILNRYLAAAVVVVDIRGGSVAKSANELNLALEEVS